MKYLIFILGLLFSFSMLGQGQEKTASSRLESEALKEIIARFLEPSDGELEVAFIPETLKRPQSTGLTARWQSAQMDIALLKNWSLTADLMLGIPKFNPIENQQSAVGQLLHAASYALHDPSSRAIGNALLNATYKTFLSDRIYFSSNAFFASGLIGLNLNDPAATQAQDRSTNPIHASLGLEINLAFILLNPFESEHEDYLAILLGFRGGVSKLFLKQDHAFFLWFQDERGNPAASSAFNYGCRLTVLSPEWGFTLGYQGRQSLSGFATDASIWGLEPSFTFTIEKPL